MQTIDADTLINFARSLEGQTLQTPSRGALFTVRVTESGLEYTPLSTGLPRTHHRTGLERICQEFSQSNSLKPGNYQHLSVNASYALVLVGLYLGHYSSDVQNKIASALLSSASQLQQDVPTTESVAAKKALSELGFVEAGEWRLENGQLRCFLARHADASHILYAFVSGEQVFYIGKSVRQLTQRMYGYQNPGPTQKTNIVNNQRLKVELEQSRSVPIWVLVVKEPIYYCGWPVNIAAGLEDILIERFRPLWNSRGVVR